MIVYNEKSISNIENQLRTIIAAHDNYLVITSDKNLKDIYLSIKNNNNTTNDQESESDSDSYDTDDNCDSCDNYDSDSVINDETN